MNVWGLLVCSPALGDSLVEFAIYNFWAFYPVFGQVSLSFKWFMVSTQSLPLSLWMLILFPRLRQMIGGDPCLVFSFGR